MKLKSVIKLGLGLLSSVLLSEAMASSRIPRSERIYHTPSEEAAYENGTYSKALKLYLPGKEGRKISLKGKAKLIDSKTKSPENVSISNDGSTLLWSSTGVGQVLPYLPIPIPTPNSVLNISRLKNGSWTKAKRHRGTRGFMKKVRKPYREFLAPFYTGGSLATSPYILPNGEEFILVDAHKIKLTGGDEKLAKAALYFFKKGRKKYEIFKKLTQKDFRLTGTPTPLKHSRISPDGKWIVIYTRGQEHQKGCHLYNFVTKKSYHLGRSDDKHCTFGPNGEKVFFHYQVGGNGDSDTRFNFELSYIGYFQLYFYGPKRNQVSWKRVMVDLPNEKCKQTKATYDTGKINCYTYHKHPIVYPGTNLLFHHSRIHPFRGGPRILVRSLKNPLKLYKVTASLVQKESNGEEIKIKMRMKHPSTTYTYGKGIYYVARPKDKSKYHIYHLDHQKIMKIQKKLQEAK